MNMIKPMPYTMIGGITPCPGGWLILPARLAGVTVIVEQAEVVETLADVLDYKPRFDAAAINAPLGLPDAPHGPYRACDEEAMSLIGWPRSTAVRPVPSRAALAAPSREAALELEPWLTRDDLRRFPLLRECAEQFQPFHQRLYFSANPDLSYTVLNDDQPLRSSPYQQAGVLERMNLVRSKLPGVEEAIVTTPPKGAAQIHLVQAAALLWTARRAAGRAISRLPTDPEWDTSGIRMELVR